MSMHRMLPFISALFLATVVGCSEQPESPATNEPAATPETAPAAPAAEAPAASGTEAPAADAAGGDRPRLVAPVKGEAELAYTKPSVKGESIGGKDFIVTTFQVKNMATGAIAGLKIEEFWYNKAGDTVTGDTYRHPKPLLPEEVATIRLETPRTPQMDRNQYKFDHANGPIRMTLVPKL